MTPPKIGLTFDAFNPRHTRLLASSVRDIFFVPEYLRMATSCVLSGPYNIAQTRMYFSYDILFSDKDILRTDGLCRKVDSGETLRLGVVLTTKGIFPMRDGL